MALRDIFSKRKQMREKAGRVEPYRYDVLPKELRIQVRHIWADAIGVYKRYDSFEAEPLSNQLWDFVHDALAREYGRARLGGDTSGDGFELCVHHLLTAPVDEALDVVEMSFRAIDTVLRKPGRPSDRATQTPDEAIAELNGRFRQHAVGYQFVNGEIVRVDSDLLHAEVIVPALTLLRAEAFEGAENEFMRAHEHHRHGRIEECLTEALKAFESTMKTICDRRKWNYDKGATASTLIDVLMKNSLIPEFLRNHFTGVRTTLEGGVPTLRNKQGGHGQGEKERDVPAYFAGYILHLAGANILLLVEAHKTLP